MLLLLGQLLALVFFAGNLLTPNYPFASFAFRFLSFRVFLKFSPPSPPAGVPDLPAEEDRRSLGASERRAGGQESVRQRGTATPAVPRVLPGPPPRLVRDIASVPGEIAKARREGAMFVVTRCAYALLSGQPS